MAELHVPQVDFSSLGQLPQIYRQGQQDALRRQTLADLGQGGQIDPTALIRSGDLSLAQLGVNLQNRQAEMERQARLDQRQTSRDAVDDRFRGASLELQRRAAARADEDKFGVKEVTDPNTGATSFVKYNTRTGDVVPTGTQTVPSAPNNPFSSGGKFNEGQGKAAGFTDRMLQSEGIISGVAPGGGQEGPPSPGVQTAGTSWAQTQLSNAREAPVVGRVANYAINTERQKYDQAKADFINAQLRRESGAAISPSEFANADKQYFPVPGDPPELVRQKAANRRAAIKGMGREGGPSYRPELTFDESGTVTPYEPARRAAPGSPPPPPKPGQLVDGYRFRGGDPSDQNNWAKAK